MLSRIKAHACAIPRGWVSVSAVYETCCGLTARNVNRNDILLHMHLCVRDYSFMAFQLTVGPVTDIVSAVFFVVSKVSLIQNAV